MKQLIGMFAVTSLVSGVVFADMYYDPTGDIATGNANLDITQVEMTDNGSDLFVTITVDSLDGDWGKYMLFMDAWDGGSDDNDNPWGRNVSGLGGMDMFAGAWLDGGGGVAGSEYSNGGWSGMANGYLSLAWDSFSITFTFDGLVATLSSAGITGLDFEVATTGGNVGDPAIDLLGDEGTQSGWGQGSTSIDLMHYDFTTIPAPSALALLAVVGLARRRRH